MDNVKKMAWRVLILVLPVGLLSFYGPAFSAVSGPGPVRILGFTAQYAPESQSVNLHWVTKGERGKVQYIIERSLDSLHFRMIGETESSGNSQKQQHYYYYDSHPVGGNMYYRIREIDTSGSQYLTPVIKTYKPITGLELAHALLSADGNELNFALISPDSSHSSLLIADVEGHIKASFVLTLKRGANMRSIYTGNLTPGIYFLQINDQDGGGSVMKKFIKKAVVEKETKDSLKKGEQVPERDRK